jgi:chromosome segregation ATPase
MKTFKRIVAWIVVIIAIVGILVALGGLAGSWVVNNRVTTVTLSLLTAGQNAITATSNGVNRIDQRLDVTHERINKFDDRVMAAGDELTETSLVVTLIDNLIGDEIRPIVAAVSDTANTIRETATAIDEVIQAVDNIPFVSLERIDAGANIFTQIADDISAIETAIDETQAEVQAKREGKIEDVVDTVTGKTDEWRTSVNNAQGRLAEADSRLDNSTANLDDLKISLPRTFLMITLAVNLLFIIMGIAFLSLMFHAISYIKDSDQTLSELLQ